MKVVAVFDVDEKELSETGHAFETEIGRLDQAGITLNCYADAEKCSSYEYAAFVWDMERKEYVQTGRAVMTEQLCRNRFLECVEKGCLAPCYDLRNVIFKKCSVSVLCGNWEILG